MNWILRVIRILARRRDCAHRWEIFKEGTLTRVDKWGGEKEIGLVFVLKCSRCGEITTRDTRL